MNDIREALKADIIEGIEVGLEDGLSPKEIASNIALMLECQDALTGTERQASHPDREALAKECELYAKIIEGITVVADDWQPGDPERKEPRETLLKAAAALRNDLSTLSVPAGWQPISTAPKDGRAVDLFYNGLRYADCYWSGSS